jgi:negative regulator of flagellin synthesis FlgM
MDIRNSLDGLRALLGVNAADPAASHAKATASVATSDWGSDSAKLSSAANQISEAASDESVRMDKITAVQQALASGTYNVPASAVSAKLVDAMLSQGQ